MQLHFRALAPLMLAFVLVLNALAYAKDSAAQAANRKHIVAAYAQMDWLAMKKDVSGMMKWLAPDFRLYASDGSSVDRAQYERMARTNIGRPGLKVALSKTTISKIEWRGPDAVVYSDSVMRMEGPNGNLIIYGKVRDYWGNAGKGWQMRQSVTLSGRITLNGKTIMER